VRRSIPGLAALLLSASVLAGCATPVPEHVPLGAQSRASLSSTEVVLPVPQSEIYIDVPASNVSAATGGGLLPALIDAGIDSARASKAAKDVTPLRNAVVDFSFDRAFSDSFSSIAATDGLNVDSVRVVKDASLAGLDQAVIGSKSGAVLVASANYHLANDAGSLWIEVHAALYHAGKAPTPASGAANEHVSAPANALYRNTFWFTVNVPHPSAKRDENLAAWAADNGELLRTDLKRGAAKISQLIVADLQGADTTTASNASDGVLERKTDGTEVFRAGQ
jgi:hypothetical protein